MLSHTILKTFPCLFLARFSTLWVLSHAQLFYAMPLPSSQFFHIREAYMSESLCRKTCNLNLFVRGDLKKSKEGQEMPSCICSERKQLGKKPLFLNSFHVVVNFHLLRWKLKNNKQIIINNKFLSEISIFIWNMDFTQESAD